MDRRHKWKVRARFHRLYKGEHVQGTYPCVLYICRVCGKKSIQEHFNPLLDLMLRDQYGPALVKQLAGVTPLLELMEEHSGSRKHAVRHA